MGQKVKKNCHIWIAPAHVGKTKKKISDALRKTLLSFFLLFCYHTMWQCIAAGALERVSNADNFSQTRGGHGKYVVA